MVSAFGPLARRSEHRSEWSAKHAIVVTTKSCVVHAIIQGKPSLSRVSDASVLKQSAALPSLRRQLLRRNRAVVKKLVPVSDGEDPKLDEGTTHSLLGRVSTQPV